MQDLDDTWQEYSKFVLAELKRLNNQIATIDYKISKLKDEEISKLRIEIATLKVKSSIFGVIGGGIPVLIMLGLELLKK